MGASSAGDVDSYQHIGLDEISCLDVKPSRCYLHRSDRRRSLHGIGWGCVYRIEGVNAAYAYHRVKHRVSRTGVESQCFGVVARGQDALVQQADHRASSVGGGYSQKRLLRAFRAAKGYRCDRIERAGRVCLECGYPSHGVRPQGWNADGHVRQNGWG